MVCGRKFDECYFPDVTMKDGKVHYIRLCRLCKSKLTRNPELRVGLGDGIVYYIENGVFGCEVSPELLDEQ